MENATNKEPWKNWSYYEYRDLLPIPSLFILGSFGLLSYEEIAATGKPGLITGASVLSTIVFVGGLYKITDFICKRNYEKYHPLNSEE